MSKLKTIQSGTTTLTTAQSANTASITAVDLSKSFLVFSYKGSSGNDDDAGLGQIRGKLTSTTQITFTRFWPGGSSSFTIEWRVIEFTSGVSVQRGTYGNVSGTVNVAISSVNTAKSFAIVTESGWLNSGVSGHIVNRARITSSTNLELYAGLTGAWNTQTEWQVVEWDTATVASYVKTLASGSATDSQTITSVGMSRSFLVGSWTSDRGEIEMRPRDWWAYRLTAATTLSYERGATTAGAWYSSVFVVSAPEIAASRYATAFTNAETAKTQAVSVSSLTGAFTITSGFNNMTSNISPDGQTYSYGAYTFTKLDSVSQASIERQGTNGYAATAWWELVDLTARRHRDFFSFFGQ